MTGLIVWSVFCLGVGLAMGAEAKKGLRAPLISGLAVGCLLWSIGVALWWLLLAFLEAAQL